jgi:UDP-N-acetylmuramoyl-tripeptide--D-alanyl-D-alanine ligase
MLALSAECIAQATAGQVIFGDPAVVGSSVAVDSRAVTHGSVFFALAGERSDGHAYGDQAVDAGARLLVVSRGDAVSGAAHERRGVAVIQVADTLAALQDLAAWYRAGLRATVVGISGSTGKTTSKDLLTAVLQDRFDVVSTLGNRNNEIGLPLTVLTASDSTDVLVTEMGMRGLGQIARVAEIAQPHIGLITNVGTSHIELLGTQDAVASAKGELVRAVPETGAVFLNGDDAFSDVLALDARAPVVRYGVGDSCDVCAEHVRIDESGYAHFELVSAQGRVPTRLPIPGRHNVYNALGAAAIALHLGQEIDAVATALGTAAVSGMRMELIESAAGVTILNDAYNANPSSMRAAVETLRTVETAGSRIAVLGDMAELGSLSEIAHFEIGESVAAANLDHLVTVGERALRIADGARASGMAAERVRPCATSEEAVEVLDDLLERGDVVLVKASRVMGLERVVEGMVSPRVG